MTSSIFARRRGNFRRNILTGNEDVLHWLKYGLPLAIYTFAVVQIIMLLHFGCSVDSGEVLPLRVDLHRQQQEEVRVSRYEETPAPKDKQPEVPIDVYIARKQEKLEKNLPPDVLKVSENGIGTSVTDEAVARYFSEPENNYLYSHVMANAWKGDAPISITRKAMTRIGWKKKIRLVISHCDKPLDWIYDKFVKTRWDQARVKSITVFNKCGNPVVGAPDHGHLTILDLPNVGRCDHSYAYWMAHIMPKIDTDEDENTIVFFMKDNSYQMRTWRNFNNMMSLAYTNGFSCAMNGVLSRGGRELSVFHDYEKLAKFQRHGHFREGNMFKGEREEKGVNKNFKSSYDNLGDYVDKLKLPIQKKYIPVCFGGAFAVTLASIRKHDPSVYSKIEKSLSRQDNLEEGHFSERVWAAILTKPLSESGIAAIDEFKDESMCTEDGFFSDRCGILSYSI